MKGKRLTPEKEKLVYALKEKGYTNRMIAINLRLHDSTVSLLLKKGKDDTTNI